MGIFKSYDIRGVWGREWDEELAYRIGRSLPGLLGASDILVGRDARESSPAVFEALSRGILRGRLRRHRPRPGHHPLRVLRHGLLPLCRERDDHRLPQPSRSTTD